MFDRTRRQARATVLLAVTALAAVLPTVLGPSARAQISPGWQEVAPLLATGITTEATAGLGGDRRIYYVRDGSTSEVYDIGGNKWTSLRATTVPRGTVGAAVTGPDGWIYFIGGGAPGGVVQSTPLVEAYDPANDSWASVASLNSPRGNGATAVSGVDGRIYVIGGNQDSTLMGVTVEAYDPKAPDDGWQQVSGMTLKQAYNSGPKAVTGPDGRIYVVAGRGEAVGVYDLDNPVAGWRTLEPVPTRRESGSYGVAVGPDGLIYVLGGEHTGGFSYVNTVEAYDPSSDSWATGPSMPTPRGYVAAATGVDERIYVMGGYTRTGNNPDQRLRTVEALTPPEEGSTFPPTTTTTVPPTTTTTQPLRPPGPCTLREQTVEHAYTPEIARDPYVSRRSQKSNPVAWTKVSPPGETPGPREGRPWPLTPTPPPGATRRFFSVDS